MKILIVSDTHSKVKRVSEIYKKLLAKQYPVDIIVHCGDYYADAMKIHDRLGVRVLAVRGNCDKCFEEDEYAILETEAGNFFVCHGHMHHVKRNKQSLYYKALEMDCVGAIFGHTHRAEKTELDDFIFINPGSINKPRDGSGGSFALLTTNEGHAEAKILRYEDLMASDDSPLLPPKKKSKVTGGFLRRIFNYSDGQ